MASFRTEGRKEFARLKPGKHEWIVDDAETKYSDKGTEQIKLTLKVGTKDQHMTVYEYLTFSEKAFVYVEAFLKSAGVYPGDDADVDIHPSSLRGLKGWCETYDRKATNEKTYVRVGKWLEAHQQNAGHLPRARQDDGWDAPAETATARNYSDEIPF